jgi:branched-chain amino acid transport system ATP-binding protein
MLEIKNVSTKYGHLPILMDVSISVGRGETVCILGANGAGKTTVLKTIIGMVKPTAGEILFDNELISNLAPHEIVKSGIAICPEREGLFPKMSIESNLFLGAYYETDKNKIQQRFEEVSSIFPIIKTRLHQKAGTLSGGERKMLTLARALMGGPKLILMDEPSLGLAPATVIEVFNVIKKIASESHISVLIIEQNAQKALDVAQRGYVLQKGSVILQGASKELCNEDFVQRCYL